MIEYSLAEQSEMPETSGFSVKIIGVGGAGANVLDRMALEGADDADLLTINTDVRALTTSVSNHKIQLGKRLLMGMGAGGDPDLGRQAAQEAEEEIRAAVKGHNMIFVCAGLGGGTGSGSTPEICRIAREEGVFLVVFATLPFTFEGRRRMEQAKVSLKKIGEFANAIVTFENDRMGELIVAKEGIQQAFAAADRIISQSIRATTSVVTQPGIIRIGMDDLLSALRSRDSRCLFGFGQAKGDNRAQEALNQALKSPLLDRGRMLNSCHNVLIHIAGGESMTLYEVELLMKELSRHVSEQTQILFGAAVDKKLGATLNVTVISSLAGDPVEDFHLPEAKEEAVSETEEKKPETAPEPAGAAVSEETPKAEAPRQKEAPKEEAVAAAKSEPVEAPEKTEERTSRTSFPSFLTAVVPPQESGESQEKQAAPKSEKPAAEDQPKAEAKSKAEPRPEAKPEPKPEPKAAKEEAPTPTPEKKPAAEAAPAETKMPEKPRGEKSSLFTEEPASKSSSLPGFEMDSGEFPEDLDSIGGETSRPAEPRSAPASLPKESQPAAAPGELDGDPLPPNWSAPQSASGLSQMSPFEVVEGDDDFPPANEEPKKTNRKSSTGYPTSYESSSSTGDGGGDPWTKSKSPGMSGLDMDSYEPSAPANPGTGGGGSGLPWIDSVIPTVKKKEEGKDDSPSNTKQADSPVSRGPASDFASYEPAIGRREEGSSGSKASKEFSQPLHQKSASLGPIGGGESPFGGPSAPDSKSETGGGLQPPPLDPSAPAPFGGSSPAVGSGGGFVLELGSESQSITLTEVGAGGFEDSPVAKETLGSGKSPESSPSREPASKPLFEEEGKSPKEEAPVQSGAETPPEFSGAAPASSEGGERKPPSHQGMLPLDPVAKGRFAKTEPTIVDGEDMDVPTFLRKRKIG